MSSVVSAGLESPAPNQVIYDAAIPISGWLDAPEPDSWVRAYIGDHCCAQTGVLFRQQNGARYSFRLLGHVPPVPEPVDAILRITLTTKTEVSLTVVEQPVRILPAALRQRPYGEVVFPENETLLQRENIYGSGPPLEKPGVEVATLIEACLPVGASVVDVGCGAGAYGPGLIASGHEWFGLEANAHCCEILERRGLPFRRVDPDSPRLPGADAEWDCAICIEVLEHIRDPAPFLGEIARLVRRRVLFSVPNLELLPYLHDWGVVPWHLLEGDHRNFFTRASLRALLSRFFASVEVFSYGEHPLRTRDGVPLHVHLFAVADHRP